MDHYLIVSIAKWMLIVESSLVILFVIVNYIIRIYHYFLFKNAQTLEDNIKALFFSYLQSSQSFSSKDLNFLKKKFFTVLNVVEEYEVSDDLTIAWETLKNEMIQNIFYPKGKKLYQSWRPYKRYYAARCFLEHFEEQDAKIVIALIKDPVLLVSLNASKVAFKFKSHILINASIDIFSKYRKIRQSIYSAIAHEADPEIESIIVDRLIHEKDPYIRTFCYQLLLQLPAKEKFNEILNADLHAKILDLRIAALNYAGYNPEYQHLLPEFLEDEQWQMRAIAADRIGRAQYMPAVEELGKRLSDHEWWVRIRAAEALGKLGDAGIKILKDQSVAKDKFAYEAAMQVLTGLGGKAIS